METGVTLPAFLLRLIALPFALGLVGMLAGEAGAVANRIPVRSLAPIAAQDLRGQTAAPTNPPRQRAGRSGARAPAPALPAAATDALPIVRGPATGQAGYVHFFLITGPDGEDETQVGIELDDGRIAWSFPGWGPVVSPFVGAGSLDSPAGEYRVRHLYGLRPVAGESAMAELRSRLLHRVSTWVDAGVPYCNTDAPPAELCLSCLAFTLHVLFPAQLPMKLDLPADFPRTSQDLHYSTEDLLLYLTGMGDPAARSARFARLQHPSVPQALRDEVVRLVGTPESVAASTVAAADVPRVPVVRERATTRQGPRQTPRRPGSIRRL